MCGMVGSYGAQPDPWVQLALDAIAHRGPDGRGEDGAGPAKHGHVRLAIQDPLPRSDQPFWHGHLLLSFVGEVWNWRDLRLTLEDQGVAFTTEGDTEVVAAALSMWGPDALAMFEGMFSVAWTNLNGETYLARDRFGKVPLYVLEEDKGSLFAEGVVRWASERKAFGGRALEAWRLPPGTWMKLPDGAPRSYYSLNAAVEGRRGASDGSDVLRMLGKAVKDRLQADVPVCCLLSGGLDSALVLALTQLIKPDVVAYAAVFDPESEDIKTARRLCRDLSVPLEEVRVSVVGEEELRESIRAIEVVSKTQVEIGTLCLPLAARIRRDGFRVCLSGEGADELFGGYGTLARRATDDQRWQTERAGFLDKMARSDFMRVNKSFMAHGVECRTPFLSRELVEEVLTLGVKACPPGKLLLKKAANPVLPGYVIQRKKVTFQGGAGLAGHLEALLAGKQRKAYNDLAREVFGGIPRG